MIKFKLILPRNHDIFLVPILQDNFIPSPFIFSFLQTFIIFFSPILLLGWYFCFLFHSGKKRKGVRREFFRDSLPHLAINSLLFVVISNFSFIIMDELSKFLSKAILPFFHTRSNTLVFKCNTPVIFLSFPHHEFSPCFLDQYGQHTNMLWLLPFKKPSSSTTPFLRSLYILSWKIKCFSLSFHRNWFPLFYIYWSILSSHLTWFSSICNNSSIFPSRSSFIGKQYHTLLVSLGGFLSHLPVPPNSQHWSVLGLSPQTSTFPLFCVTDGGKSNLK